MCPMKNRLCTYTFFFWKRDRRRTERFCFFCFFFWPNSSSFFFFFFLFFYYLIRVGAILLVDGSQQEQTKEAIASVEIAKQKESGMLRWSWMDGICHSKLTTLLLGESIDLASTLPTVVVISRWVCFCCFFCCFWKRFWKKNEGKRGWKKTKRKVVPVLFLLLFVWSPLFCVSFWQVSDQVSPPDLLSLFSSRSLSSTSLLSSLSLPPFSPQIKRKTRDASW